MPRNIKSKRKIYTELIPAVVTKPALKEKVYALAEIRQVSMSALIRHILTKYLNGLPQEEKDQIESVRKNF